MVSELYTSHMVETLIQGFLFVSPTGVYAFEFLFMLPQLFVNYKVNTINLKIILYWKVNEMLYNIYCVCMLTTEQVITDVDGFFSATAYDYTPLVCLNSKYLQYNQSL